MHYKYYGKNVLKVNGKIKIKIVCYNYKLDIENIVKNTIRSYSCSSKNSRDKNFK